MAMPLVPVDIFLYAVLPKHVVRDRHVVLENRARQGCSLVPHAFLPLDSFLELAHIVVFLSSEALNGAGVSIYVVEWERKGLHQLGCKL